MIPGRLSTEVALYQIDWKDMQVFTSSAGFSGIGNAGRARSRGLEWTLRAAPIDSLRLATSLSVIDAKLVDDSPDLGGRAGERLPNTARVSAAVRGVLCSLMAIATKIEFEWFLLKQWSSDRGHQAYYRFRILESSCHPTPLR